MSAGRRLDERLRRAARGDGDGRLRILAVVIGPRRTSAATWTPGAVDCPAVRIGDGPNGSMPSAVAWNGEGYVVGSTAERLIAHDPSAGVVSPIPLTGQYAVPVGDREAPVEELIAAIIHHVLRMGRYRPGRGTRVVLARPEGVGSGGDPVLAEAARLAGVPAPELVIDDLPRTWEGADDPVAATALGAVQSNPELAHRVRESTRGPGARDASDGRDPSMWIAVVIVVATAVVGLLIGGLLAHEEADQGRSSGSWSAETSESSSDESPGESPGGAADGERKTLERVDQVPEPARGVLPSAFVDATDWCIHTEGDDDWFCGFEELPGRDGRARTVNLAMTPEAVAGEQWKFEDPPRGLRAETFADAEGRGGVVTLFPATRGPDQSWYVMAHYPDEGIATTSFGFDGRDEAVRFLVALGFLDEGDAGSGDAGADGSGDGAGGSGAGDADADGGGDAPRQGGRLNR